MPCTLIDWSIFPAPKPTDIHIYRVTHLNFTALLKSSFPVFLSHWNRHGNVETNTKTLSSQLLVFTYYLDLLRYNWKISSCLFLWVYIYVCVSVFVSALVFVRTEFCCVELFVYKTIFGNLFYMAFFPILPRLVLFSIKNLFWVLYKQNSAVA